MNPITRLGAALLCVLGAGLASRRLDSLPDVVVDHAGDILWAMAVVLGLALVRPGWPAVRVAAATLVIAVVVELSQLWNPGWLGDLRDNDLLALVLGRGFLWGDLVRYVGGVALGLVIVSILGASSCASLPRHT